jgi:hypothetical protein
MRHSMAVNGGASRASYRKSRRLMRDGVCAAALRAVTGARVYKAGEAKTLPKAAAMSGSCPAYVQAALVLIEADNHTLIDQVLTGRLPILAAARQVKQLSKLVDAYRAASASDRIAFGQAIGVTTLFDHSVAPLL